MLLPSGVMNDDDDDGDDANSVYCNIGLCNTRTSHKLDTVE